MSSSSKQSKYSKERHRKFIAIVEADVKANPTMKYQEDAAKELCWKGVKDDPEKQRQMMLEFPTKEASQK